MTDCDGTELNSSVPSSFDVPGSYVVMIGGSSEEREALRFTIVNPTTGMLESYRMPDYFAITDLTVDGEAREVAPNVVDMSEEGDYKITYYCQPTGEAYQLNVTVDHTPPTLALEASKTASLRVRSIFRTSSAALKSGETAGKLGDTAFTGVKAVADKVACRAADLTGLTEVGRLQPDVGLRCARQST